MCLIQIPYWNPDNLTSVSPSTANLVKTVVWETSEAFKERLLKIQNTFDWQKERLLMKELKTLLEEATNAIEESDWLEIEEAWKKFIVFYNSINCNLLSKNIPLKQETKNSYFLDNVQVSIENNTIDKKILEQLNIFRGVMNKDDIVNYSGFLFPKAWFNLITYGRNLRLEKLGNDSEDFKERAIEIFPSSTEIVASSTKISINPENESQLKILLGKIFAELPKSINFYMKGEWKIISDIWTKLIFIWTCLSKKIKAKKYNYTEAKVYPEDEDNSLSKKYFDEYGKYYICTEYSKIIQLFNEILQWEKSIYFLGWVWNDLVKLINTVIDNINQFQKK